MKSTTAYASGITVLVGMLPGVLAAEAEEFVRISPRDHRYLELSDGAPYIPIGLNMIGPPGGDLDGMARWMDKLADNGGNFIRVWLGSSFFDVEHTRSGEYDEQKAERIDAMLDLARERGIRVKMCIESFRHFGTREQPWSEKSLHLIENGGTAKDIADFFDGERSRERFKRKLAWFADRYGDDPTIFGWELWNEINAVAGGDYLAWSEVMLAELHRLFPRNLALQSLGSFDRDGNRNAYQRHSTMPGNDLAQVHRYLDLGAQLEVCHGPMDLLAADAVAELRAFDPQRPILLAEGGAVEPSHTGPFKLYDKDEAGVILHDVLFAPFFVGAAGPGHIWHWDRYVDQMNLWHHFGRFARAVEGIDPPAEGFEPLRLAHPRLRIYVLRGRTTTLMWCRDSLNTWQSELRDGEAPEELRDARVDADGLLGNLTERRTRTYDPWQDEWADAAVRDGAISLPPFSRSIVVRIDAGE